MGGQTDAMKTYRENQMKIGAGEAKPMSPTEAATYSQLDKQGMSGSPDESLKNYLNAAQGMYGDLKSQASKMISPNLFGRDTSAPATQETQDKKTLDLSGEMEKMKKIEQFFLEQNRQSSAPATQEEIEQFFQQKKMQRADTNNK